jgi:hypothetical protein
MLRFRYCKHIVDRLMKFGYNNVVPQIEPIMLRLSRGKMIPCYLVNRQGFTPTQPRWIIHPSCLAVLKHPCQIQRRDTTLPGHLTWWGLAPERYVLEQNFYQCMHGQKMDSNLTAGFQLRIICSIETHFVCHVPPSIMDCAWIRVVRTILS